MRQHIREAGNVCEGGGDEDGGQWDENETFFSAEGVPAPHLLFHRSTQLELTVLHKTNPRAPQTRQQRARQSRVGMCCRMGGFITQISSEL